LADGVHARTDGFTSLAVVLGAGGVMLGLPPADPIVGLLISATIVVLLWGTVCSIGRRLMDGIEPDLVSRAKTALEGTAGVLAGPCLQLRWVGHRLQGTATIVVADADVSAAERTIHASQHRLKHALPKLDDMVLKPTIAHAH
jgi:divalent metal cation (Fe/Co/Zn/Cd) transporter